MPEPGRIARAPAPESVTDRYNDRMPIEMTATEAKSKFLALLDEVAGGQEVTITKHGRTVARLVPARGKNQVGGWLSHVAVSSADETELFSTTAPWDLS